MSSVREMVRALRKEMREDPDLQPDRATAMLIELTALYGNTLDECREADMAYNGVLLAALNGDEAASRAKIRAQATPEYARMRAAKDTEREVLESIRTLKRFIASKQEEMRLTR
jgi:hypothetical protein